jgi:putative ABC transport system ATP-binding protein
LLASAGVRDLLSGSNGVLVPDGTRHPARAGGHAGVPSDSLAEPRLQTGCTETSDRRTVTGTVMARAELEGAFVVSAGEDGQPLLVAEQVSKVYRTGEIEVQALAELNLAVNRGELVAVMGPSGSGKTTLLNCLSGLDDIDGGRVLLEGRDLFAMSDAARTTHRAKAMGFIFQSFNLIPVFTAVENVELPLLLGGTPARQARKRATEMLTRVGLGQRTGHRPNELSGGEQQRVTIARALASRPAIVWADEPTGNLDSQMADQVVELLHELNEVDGQTILLVTHDAGIGASAGRLIHMRDGRLVRDEVQVGAGTAPDGHGVMLDDSGA